MHVVGVHAWAAGAQSGKAVVKVTAKGKPVVLVLCAYNSFEWRVDVDPEVEIAQVIVGGYHRQFVEGLPAGTKVSIFTHDGREHPKRLYFFAHERDIKEYPDMVQKLKILTGMDVTSFQGQYRYPGKPIVVGALTKTNAQVGGR